MPSAKLVGQGFWNTYKYQVKLGIYWSAIGWCLLAGGLVSTLVLKQDLLDRQYPSPSEWHWLIRVTWREAKEEVETEGRGRGAVEWISAGSQFRSVVSMLEDFTLIWHHPSGLELQDDYDRTIPGLEEADMHSAPPASRTGVPWRSRIGYDVSMKSEPWRRGYFEAMLTVARAAGYREGYMTDVKDGTSYAPQHVRSPTNPYPKPLPPTKDGKKVQLPDFTDCVLTFEPADFHFKRLLTTKGFNRGQRIEAAVAYADYLEQADRTQQASDLLDWTMNVACEGVPNAPRLIDPKTAVLRADAPFVTRNIITAATALANFRARNDDVKRGLAIFLSIFRARQTAPAAPPERQYPAKPQEYSLSSMESALRWIASLATLPEFPAPPPSGDLPYERSAGVECEDAALMAHVGEILFARTNQRGEGFEWSQRASGIAKQRKDDLRLTNKGKRVCEQCYLTSLGNLNKMAALLASEQQAVQQPGTAGWFGFNAKDRLLSDTDWVTERDRLATELLEFEDSQLRRRLNATISGQSSLFVV